MLHLALCAGLQEEGWGKHKDQGHVFGEEFQQREV